MPTPPLHWPWALQSPPVLSSESTAWGGALLRCWSGTSPVMEQPPLDQHYVVMHLGGAKRVTRRCDGPGVCSVVENRSLTLVPAGSAYRWQTEGPIAFAHLYVAPRQLQQTIERELDVDARGVTLVDRVGWRDEDLEPLLGAMIDEVAAASRADSLRLDCLFESVCLRLGRRHASGQQAGAARALALAPYRLRRVLDFIDANLARDIGLAELAAAAGSSQSHFSHAFRLATGCPPYRHLLRRRIERARILLLTGNGTLAHVSAACGFRDAHQFALMFKRVTGVGPKRFRLARGATAARGGPVPLASEWSHR